MDGQMTIDKLCNGNTVVVPLKNWNPYACINKCGIHTVHRTLKLVIGQENIQRRVINWSWK